MFLTKFFFVSKSSEIYAKIFLSSAVFEKEGWGGGEGRSLSRTENRYPGQGPIFFLVVDTLENPDLSPVNCKNNQSQLKN